MKKSIIILFFLLLNFLHFNIAFTDGLTLGGYQSIAPISIPQGINKVGMTEIKFRSGGNGDTTSISQITVKLTGTVLPDDIINVYVFFDGGNKSYDGGSIDDIDAIESGGPVQFDGSNSIIVDIDPAIVQFGWGGWSYLYIAFDISSNADFLKTVGCEVDNIVYGDPPDGTGGTGSPLILSPHGVTENIDSYEVTLDVLGIAPAQAEQGENDIKILKLTFTSLDADASTYMDSIRLHRVGTGSDADIATGGVSLYDDSGTVKGELDPGDQVIASGSISGGYVLLDPTTDIQITSAGNDIFFVTLNISLTATVGNTVGLEVEDPSTDVVFIDVISDLYTQLGYIVNNTPTPGLGNTLEIIQATILDTTPPEVAYTNPSNQETGVSLTTSVTVVFSESIDPSTVTTTTFFLSAFALGFGVGGAYWFETPHVGQSPKPIPEKVLQRREESEKEKVDRRANSMVEEEKGKIDRINSEIELLEKHKTELEKKISEAKEEEKKNEYLKKLEGRKELMIRKKRLRR